MICDMEYTRVPIFIVLDSTHCQSEWNSIGAVLFEGIVSHVCYQKFEFSAYLMKASAKEVPSLVFRESFFVF